MNNKEGVCAMPRNFHTKSKVARVMMVNCNHIHMGVHSNRKANINTNYRHWASVISTIHRHKSTAQKAIEREYKNDVMKRRQRGRGGTKRRWRCDVKQTARGVMADLLACRRRSVLRGAALWGISRSYHTYTALACRADPDTQIGELD